MRGAGHGPDDVRPAAPAGAGSAAWAAVANATGIPGGTAVLDVGCGAGGFCVLAAARGAAVHGLDVTPAAIERARRRVPDGDFRLGLMEDLPWPDDSFDVVTGFDAFQYALDIDLALSEARRVLRPGGLLAICKWARPEDNELFALLIAFGAGRSGSLRAADPLEAAIRRARLAVCDTGEIPVVMELRDAAALEAALVSAGALASAGDEPERRRLLDAAAPYRQPDGSYRFGSRRRYVVATT
jgi:SAM-dependent methyltransferase